MSSFFSFFFFFVRGEGAQVCFIEPGRCQAAP